MVGFCHGGNMLGNPNHDYYHDNHKIFKRELIPSSRIILLSTMCVADMIRNHRDDDYCDHPYSYHSDK